MFIASFQELGNVEAYYWALSRKLEWNYFDHPPMVAWLIRLTTLNLFVHNELFVRLGAILSSAICTWLMYLIGNALYNARAGWFAALLYATSTYSGMGIGVYILPDSPQMVFWLASIFTLIKIVRLNSQNSHSRGQWLLFGLLVGFCIMCKVHGVFLWIGAVLYFLIYDHAGLKNRYVLIAMGVTLIIISPIIIWNFQHHFISYRFHSNRINISASDVDGVRFIKQFSKIIFLTGPIHFVLICISIFYVVKGKLLRAEREIRLLLLCCFPLILVVCFIGIFIETLPHWPGPALSTLLVLPAIKLASNLKNKKIGVPTVLKFGIAYFLVIVAVDYFSVAVFPGTLSIEKEGMKIGSDDATLDMYGWKQAGKKFDSLYWADITVKLMPAGVPVVVTDWITAAHIDYYIGTPLGPETWGLGDAYSLHQYFWMNKYKKTLVKGENAYGIIPSNLYTYKNFNKVTDNFRGYNFAIVFPEYRGGIICKVYYVIRLYNYKGAEKWEHISN